MLQVLAEMQKVLGEDVSPKKSSEYVLSPRLKKSPLYKFPNFVPAVLNFPATSKLWHASINQIIPP